MLIYDVIEKIESFFKKEYSCEYVKKYSSYDNSGFLIGDCKRPITSCVLCVDVTGEAVEYAIKKGANLIVSHHPIIYMPISSVTSDTPTGRNILKLIKNDICVYSSHLCMDIAKGGINDEICSRLDVKDTKPLFDVLDSGLGRIGNVKEVTFGDFFKKSRTVFNDSTMWSEGNLKDRISVVSILAGGGGGETDNVILSSKMGAEVYISSDFKHHVIVLAREIGMKLISVSHYKMEYFAIDILKKLLNGIECHVL